ncbi:MAG: DUF2085 domain-containing protein [Methanobacteriota archaeon]|nr:MAG: DUF2085 domain-containing protein [Euryarchaeota archaeon]
MRLPRITSLAVLMMFVVTSVWLVLVVLSPYLVPEGTLTDLSGVVGMRDNAEAFSDLDLLPRAVYTIGDSQCHQISERSYFLNGNQMPFCSRDLGLFIGLAVASGVAVFVTTSVNPLLLLLGLVPIGIDGGLQAVTDYESTNPLRITTGVIAGISLALLLALFLVALKDEADRKREQSETDSVGDNRKS